MRDTCPAWCRGHTVVEQGIPSQLLHHDAAGVTVESPIPRPPDMHRTAVWATAPPEGGDPKIVITRCVPPPALPWRLDLTRDQARQLAGLADGFAPGLASALRTTLAHVERADTGRRG